MSKSKENYVIEKTRANMTPFTEFTYWFTHGHGTTFVVKRKDDPTQAVLGLCDSETGVFTPTDADDQVFTQQGLDDIRAEFQLFKEFRPEYTVSERIVMSTMSPADAVDRYQRMLIGCALIRAKRRGLDNPDDALPKLSKCIDWLASTDFYDAPGSSVYHDSKPQGLLYHTLRVAQNVMLLCDLGRFSTVNIEDAVLIALVHDWCKIYRYEYYLKNVQDESGVWNKVPAYRRRTTINVPMGHGELSLHLAQSFFRLSLEESLAIRWHMGAWRVVPDDMNDLQAANENFPMVHLIQFADQLSIVNY